VPSRVEPRLRNLVRRRGGGVFKAFVDEISLNPQIFLGEVAMVVLLSSFYERGEKWLRNELRLTGNEAAIEILNVLFKEITGLGFIGLLLFIATRSGTASALSAQIFRTPALEEGSEDPLAETFEDVHIMIFMLMVVLLFQAAASLVITQQISKVWRGFSQTRAFGTAEGSLESKFVEAGYLERVPNSSAPRGIDLVLKKPFSFGRGFWERYQLRTDSFHKLVMWRAIRHEFLFPRSKVKRGEEMIRDNPEYGLLSFEAYLTERLGRTAVALVEVDTETWFLTFLLLIPLVYACVALPEADVLKIQCAAVWLLAAASLALAVVLEEDTYELTPKVPRDARQTLRLFDGTSSQMLRRAAQLAPNAVRGGGGGGASASSVMGRRYRPGLGDAQARRRPFLGRPLGYYVRKQPGQENRFPSCDTYLRILRLLNFLLAVCITSLIVTYLTQPPETALDLLTFGVAWTAWPVVFFWLYPMLLRRLTVRNSIEDEKDLSVLRECIVQGKQSLLRDLMRLIQIAGFERRAEMEKKAWTQRGGATWTKEQAAEMCEKGSRLFKKLPRQQQLEIWDVFGAADVDNDGHVSADELKDMCFQVLSHGALSNESLPMESAQNIVRLVDFEGKQRTTWPGFQALMMLATVERPAHEQRDDLERFFDAIDEDQDNEITVFELAGGVQGMRVALTSDDVSNFLYTHFDTAKPTINKAEFIEWLEPYGMSVRLESKA